MDLSLYYQKIRNAEAKIVEAFPVVVSHETPDGGKPGVLTEVTRRIAAKMMVDGLAHLASAEEAKTFAAANAKARRVADQVAMAAKVQFAVLSPAELDKLKGAPESAGN